MSGEGRWFVLIAEDEDYGCPCLEQRFRVERLDDLAAVLGKEAADDPELGGPYWLDDRELEALHHTFGVGEEFAEFDSVVVKRWHCFREFPYLVHTGYELFLLLEGRKQLAQFMDAPEWLADYLQPFECHVAEGRLVKRVFDQPVQPELQAKQIAGPTVTCLRRVLFVRPGQEWRIDAFLMMGDVFRLTGWNDTLEAFEGALYGYEDWQIQWWLAHRREQRKQIGST